MSDPIAEAIARSQAAVAVIPTTAVANAPAATPVKLSMESMAAGSMNVDKWLKVNEDGLKIGESKLITDPILVSLDMTEGVGFMLKYAIKGGNPAQYAYTADLVNAAGGGSWPDAQARIRALAPSATPYRAVDLPFTLEQEVKAGGVVVGVVGDTIGYTTSTTNWGNWQAFYKEVSDARLLGQRVQVKLTSQPRTNKAGNVWGVVAFELVGAAE